MLTSTKSGIPLIHIPATSQNGHFIVCFPTGSRNENDKLFGLYHVLEHMLFKGTSQLNYLQLINAVEKLGGDFNAFTTKENVVLHVSYPDKFSDEIISIISEVVYDSVFNEDELKKEKNVIIDEIRTYRDTPSEFIYDEFERCIFAGHPLCHDILGTIASVNRITDADLHNLMKEIQPHLFLVVVSNKSEKDISSTISSKFTSKYEKYTCVNQPMSGFYRKNKVIKDDVSQTHYIGGILTDSYISEERQALLLLSSMLGGNSMGSLMNLELREKHGLTYSVECALTSYSETGFLYYYLTCDHGKLNKSLTLIEKLFAKIKKNGFTDDEIESAVNILQCQYSIELEQSLNKALFIAKHFQYFNDCINVDEWVNNFGKISKKYLHEMAEKYLDFEHHFSVQISKK